MKSCLNVFPVVSIWIIFFGLNSFSSPVSPEFSVTMSLQGTVTSLFSFERLSEPSPCLSLPHPCPQGLLCSSFILHAWGCHHCAQHSRQGLSTVFCRTTWMLLSLHWKHVVRGILTLDLPFMVGSHWWQYSFWQAQWPSAFSPFPFPVFSANSPHQSLNDLALYSTEVYYIVCLFGITVFSAWYLHLLPYWQCLPSSCHPQISKAPSYY